MPSPAPARSPGAMPLPPSGGPKPLSPPSDPTSLPPELKWRAETCVLSQRARVLYIQSLRDARAGCQPALDRLTSKDPAPIPASTTRPLSGVAGKVAAAGAAGAAVAAASGALSGGAGAALAASLRHNADTLLRTAVDYLCSQGPWLEVVDEFAKGGFERAVHHFLAHFGAKLGVELQDGAMVTMARAADWFRERLKALGLTAGGSAPNLTGGTFMALLFEVLQFAARALMVGPKAAAAELLSKEHLITSLLTSVARGVGVSVLGGSGWAGVLISAAVCMAVAGLVQWLFARFGAADSAGWGPRLDALCRAHTARREVTAAVRRAARASPAAAPTIATWEPAPRDDMYIPEELICPISGTLMVQPVGTLTGQVYDREWLLAWFARCGSLSCPLTSQPLEPGQVFPWREGRALVQHVAAHHGLRESTMPPAWIARR